MFQLQRAVVNTVHALRVAIELVKIFWAVDRRLVVDGIGFPYDHHACQAFDLHFQSAECHLRHSIKLVVDSTRFKVMDGSYISLILKF